MKKHLLKSIATAFIAIIILLVISLALPCLPAQAAASDPVFWGVFIGVSYPFSNPEIVYADDDARELYDTLSPVWGTSHTKILIDSQANEAGILNAIDWLADNAQPNDTVTFTFSGLGVAPGAICPADFSPLRGGLTATQLADAFAAVQAGKILIILDCNYSGKFRVSLSKEGRVLMLSSSAQEESKESLEYRHGVFTYFILQALNNLENHDTNQNHELSAEEIASYADEMTANYFTHLNPQHPVLEDQVSGELPLLADFAFSPNVDLPSGTTILTLDDVDYTSPPAAQLWVPGSTHTMTIPDVVDVNSDARYIFIGWNDGNTSVNRTISKGSYVTNYRHEYLFTVTSPYGVTTGTGWYRDGSIASFSVTTSVETTYTRRTFTGWSGDFTESSSTGSLIMDAPKTVTAIWRTEYLLVISSEYNEPVGAGWYDEGQAVNISIEPVQGSIIRQIFNGWSGDFINPESSAILTMNSPKVVIATWRADYFWLYIIIVASVLVLGGAVAGIIILVWRRTSGK